MENGCNFFINCVFVFLKNRTTHTQTYLQDFYFCCRTNLYLWNLSEKGIVLFKSFTFIEHFLREYIYIYFRGYEAERLLLEYLKGNLSQTKVSIFCKDNFEKLFVQNHSQ